MATTRPDVDFPDISLPIADNTVEVYSQRNGVPGKLSLENLKIHVDQSLSIVGNDLTITREDGDQTITLPSGAVNSLANGLTLNADVGELGGTLTKATQISCGAFQLLVLGTNNFTVSQQSGNDITEIVANRSLGVSLRRGNATDPSAFTISLSDGGLTIAGYNGDKFFLDGTKIGISTADQRGATAKDGAIMRLKAVSDGEVEYTDFSIPAAISGQDGSMLIVTDFASKSVDFSAWSLPLVMDTGVDGSVLQITDKVAGTSDFTPYALPLTLSGKPDGGLVYANGTTDLAITPYRVPKTVPPETGDYTWSYNSVSGQFFFKEVQSGKFVGSTDVNGRLNINHSLSQVPSSAILSMQTLTPYVAVVESVNSGSISVRVFDMAGVPLNVVAVTINWYVSE